MDNKDDMLVPRACISGMFRIYADRQVISYQSRPGIRKQCFSRQNSLPFMKKPALRYAFLLIAALHVAAMVFCAGCESSKQKTGKPDGFDDFVTDEEP